MEAAIEAVCNADMKDRIDASNRLVHVVIGGESMTPDQVLRVVEALVGWLSANNYKIVASGLESLQYVIACDPDAASPLIADLSTAVRDNFGDSHEQVRDQCMELLMYLVDDVSTPQAVWDHIAGGLSHRVPRVRQYCLLFFERVVSKHGQRAIQISPHLRTIVSMVTDRDEGVREAAASALCEVYRQVGQRVKRDISRVAGIPQAKMSALLDRLDTVAIAHEAKGGGAPSSPKAPRRSAGHVGRPGGSGRSRGSSAAVSGGVDPDEFAASMTAIEPQHVGSDADIEALFRDLKKVLPDTSAEWEKRAEVCRRLRGVVSGNAPEFPSFIEHIQASGSTLASGVSDLRSAVSKEACITISQLSSVLQLEFEAPLKAVIPVLLRQTQIHTKVLAQSARLGLDHVFATCQAPRLLLLLRESAKHRAVEIRRAVHNCVRLVLEVWDPETLKKQLQTICDMVHDAQVDADGNVRQLGRASYWLLEPQFPSQANAVFRRLDSNKQKHLMKAKNGAAEAPRATRFVRKASSPTFDEGGDGHSPRGSASGPARVSLSSSMPASALRREKEVGHLVMPQRVARPSTTSTSKLEDRGASRGTSSGGPRRVQAAGRSGSAIAASSAATPRRVTRPVSGSVQAPKEQKVSAMIENALALADDADWGTREEATKLVAALISPEFIGRFMPRDVKRLSSYFLARLQDPNSVVLGSNADVLRDFLLQCADNLPNTWIRECTSGLINRVSSNDITQTARSKLGAALAALQSTVPSDLQLELCFQTLSKSKQYSIEFSTASARIAQLNHMAKMASTCAPAAFAHVYSANEIDCIAAIQRLASYCTKSTVASALQKESKTVIIELFKADPASFADIFSKLPSADNKALRKVLNASELDWETMLESTGDSPFLTRSHGPKSSTEAFDMAVSGATGELGFDDDDDILGTNFMDETNLIDEGLLNAQHPINTASSANAADLNGVANAGPFDEHQQYNPTEYEDDGGASPSHEDVDVEDFHGPDVDDGSQDIDQDVDSGMPDLDGYKATVYAEDFALNGATDVENDIVPMLDEFIVAAKEYPEEFWAQYFDTILPPVMELLDHDIQKVRGLSLKALRHLLKTQTSYFGDAIALVLRKLLGMHAEKEHDILRSAEETLSILSSTVHPRKAALLLNPIIASEDGQVLLASIKLLTKVLKKLSKHDLEDLLEDIIPGLAERYKHPMAEVRKGVVFALVEMHMVLGDSMMPHLSSLSSSQMKLLGIYIKRAEDKVQEQRSTGTAL